MKIITENLKFINEYPDRAGELAKRLHVKKDEIPFVRKYYTSEKQEADKKKRSVISYISTGALDRDGEKLLPEGVNLENYKKNPVVMLGHDYKSLPVGKNIWIKKDDKGLVAKTVFAKSERGDEIYRACTEDIEGTGPLLQGWSVGFIPIEWEDIETKDKKEKPGRIYNKWELLEYSIVPIPSCPEALTLAMEKGLISDRLKKDLEIEVVKDREIMVTKEEMEFIDNREIEAMKKVIIKPETTEKYHHIPVNPGCEITATITISASKGIKATYCGKVKKIHTYLFDVKKWTMAEAQAWVEAQKEFTEALQEQFILEDEEADLTKGKIEEKGVIPYKDLGKADEGESWDGPGEVAAADVSDLKLMCAWMDSANSDVKSSYKLPHHKASGHAAVWKGVAAAMAALLGARGGVQIPSGDRKGVYNHLKKHYAQWDKEVPEFKDYTAEELKEIFDEEILKLIIEEKQEKFNCECIECGHKLTSEEHCDKIKCPKCGGKMRRVERPGPGKTVSDGLVTELRIMDIPEFKEYMGSLQDQVTELKEGRVLSTKNRTLVKNTIEALATLKERLDELYTATEPSKGEEKQKYNCECIKCGYKMTSDEHCDKLKCPECGGEMRRLERPGPGKEVGLEIIKSEPSTTNAIEALFSSGKFAEMIDKAMKEAFDINIKKKLGRVE